MSTTSTEHPLLGNNTAFTTGQEQAILLAGTNNPINESIASVDQTKNIATENCDSSSDTSEDANEEMSWLAKIFDPTIQKVERWEEDWDTSSESEDS